MMTSRSTRPWAAEFQDLIRAASGGLLFGVPMLYTMEVWWVGSTAGPLRLYAILAFSFIPIFLLNRTSGFRSTNEVGFIDALMDTVDAMAISLVCVTAILVVLREITATTPIGQALGKVLYEGIPFSIGVGLASHFLTEQGGDETDSMSTNESDQNDMATEAAKPDISASVSDSGATLIGALVVAFSIAPTDEVPLLASAINSRWLIVLVGVSLLVSYAIVFEAEFTSQQQRHEHQGLFQTPMAETVVSYLLSLLAAYTMLWFFDRISPEEPWFATLTHVVVLGFPAAVGGAAGRLAV
jgi:putative integral membrane protein (TIGR02587 family)